MLLYLSFPPHDLSFLAWISFTPLLISLSYARHLEGLLTASVTGIVLGVLNGQWLNEMPGMPLISYVAIVLYFGIFYGLFGIFFSFITRRTTLPRVFIAPILWVSIEYLRSNLSFLALPWLLIGYSQHGNIPIIQIASYTSVYGISFLVLCVNAAISEVFLWLLSRRKIMTIQQPLTRAAVASITSTLVMIFAAYVWGDHEVKIYDKNSSEKLTASLIHTSINQEEKFDPKFRVKIMDYYRELTLQAYKENPNVIIWPETALPAEFGTDSRVDQSVKSLAKETGTPLLFGCASYAKMEKWGIKIRKHKNSAYLIDKEGKILGAYHKMRLVPFYEYLPLEGRFSWPKWLVPEHGIDLPGMQYTVFRLLDKRFGLVICWESWFPELFRIFVKDGAEFMINLINEAPLGKTVVSQETLFMSVFRAVENRVALLRCANAGITALIDPLGRIKKKVTGKNGEDIVLTDILTVTIPESRGPTFYTRNGDIFVIACAITASLCILLALLPVKLRMSLKITKDHE